MRFLKNLLGGPQVGGYIKFFGLEKWYLQLTPEQQALLHQVRSDLTSANVSSTSQTVGQFISACARSVREHDLDFAEQLYHQALKLESEPIHRHYILMDLADFYKSRRTDAAKWYRTVQDDLALLPTFAKAWLRQEKMPLPSYPALDEMIRIFRNRGDLPEALTLCEEARKIEVAGDWETQIKELQRRMRD